MAAGSMHISVIMQTIVLVGSAEIFDKTFFIAMVLAMQYRKKGASVFLGCYSALLVHVLIAALCGYAISTLMSPRALDMAAAILYAVFAGLYAKDYLSADADSKCEFEDTQNEFACAETEVENYGIINSKKLGKPIQNVTMKVLMAGFTATFIGEFGDRTQIAMIGQHASQPIVPVCIGSSIAFFILCLIAVVSGNYLSDCAVTERQVCLIGGLSFATFAVVSAWEAYHTTEFRDPVAGAFLQIVR